MASVENYYNNIEDKRIQVLSGRDYAQIKSEEKHIGEDKRVMYLIQDSTNTGYIGRVEINIYDRDFADSMNLDKAIKVIALLFFMFLYKIDFMSILFSLLLKGPFSARKASII